MRKEVSLVMLVQGSVKIKIFLTWSGKLCPAVAAVAPVLVRVVVVGGIWIVALLVVVGVVPPTIILVVLVVRVAIPRI
jgi:hypothetical protein